MALSAMLAPRVAFPAVPPASTGSSVQSSDTASAAGPVPAPVVGPGQSASPDVVSWSMPPVRVGGSLSYEVRHDSEERRKMVQRGLIATIHAASETFIWQPWFAQVGGNLRLNSSRNSSSHIDTDFGVNNNELKGLIVTGSGQLRILPLSRMPFEAHIEKNDSRTSSQLVSFGDYSSMRMGFTQQYMYDQGSALLGFERSSQDSTSAGRDSQDNLQLNLSHTLELHRISVNGSFSRNEHERTGENQTQDNLTLQHNYTPIPELTVDTTANVGRSGFQLVQGENQTRLTQVSSMAFWRPEEMPLTVIGGARMLALASDNVNNVDLGPATSRLRNANFNVGATYDLSQFVHLNAAANVNSVDTNGTRSNTANQSAGATYQPDTIELGDYRYNWTASSTASHATGGTDSSRQLTLQLSHSINRHFKLSPQSTLTFELNQALSGIAGIKSLNGEQVATKHATHGGSVSWNMNTGEGSATARLSLSDSRSLDGAKDYFQLINFQASSNLPTGSNTSWSGNLTIQASRQGGNRIPLVNGDPATANTLPIFLLRQQQNEDFNITSSGSLTYQNNRIFGVRGMRFVSDLRLNGQALLPLFGGPQDQEVAAWDNRLEYFIGRTLFRVSALIARTKAPLPVNAELINQQNDGPVRLNKSIMFTVTRDFGAS